MKAIVLFLLLAIVQAGSGAFVKIKVHPDEKISAHFRRQAQVSNACQDVVSVERDSVINNLAGNASQVDVRVTFWRSQFLTDMLEAIQQTTVPGLGETTVANVFAIYQNQSCFPFIFGGAVRDQFLGVAISDVDVELAGCARERVLQICVENWGEANCDDGYFLGIGGNIDAATADMTFLYASVSRLEYTVNSIAYDVGGSEAILDLASTGVVNICNRTIRIPSDDDSVASWDEWRMQSPNKILRFWKLREKGLTAINAATQTYIVGHATTTIENDPNTFNDFYCDNVYDSEYDESTMACVDLAEENCARAEVMRDLYDRVLTEDFGAVWTSRTPPILPQCSSAAAVGVTIATMLYVVAMVMMTQLIN